MQTCRQPNICSIKVAMVKKLEAAGGPWPPKESILLSLWMWKADGSGLDSGILRLCNVTMCLQFCQRRNLRRIRTPSAYRETWDRVWRLLRRGHSVSWTAATASWRRFDVARFFAHFHLPSISCRFPSPHRKPMWTRLFVQTSAQFQIQNAFWDTKTLHVSLRVRYYKPVDDQHLDPSRWCPLQNWSRPAFTLSIGNNLFQCKKSCRDFTWSIRVFRELDCLWLFFATKRFERSSSSSGWRYHWGRSSGFIFCFETFGHSLGRPRLVQFLWGNGSLRWTRFAHKGDSVFKEIQEGRDIVETLQQRWFMPRLCALHVARLYELSNPDVFHARSCPILGPGALNFLKQLFPWEGATLEDNATWQTHLKTTARRLHSAVFEVAVNLLGPDLARQL